MTTLALSASSARPTASPIPEVDPATIAVFPRNPVSISSRPPSTRPDVLCGVVPRSGIECLLGDVLGDGQRRRRGGRRRVAHRHHPAVAGDPEVVDERAVGAERLCPYPAGPWHDVVDGELR